MKTFVFIVLALLLLNCESDQSINAVHENNLVEEIEIQLNKTLNFSLKYPLAFQVLNEVEALGISEIDSTNLDEIDAIFEKHAVDRVEFFTDFMYLIESKTSFVKNYPSTFDKSTYLEVVSQNILDEEINIQLTEHLVLHSQKYPHQSIYSTPEEQCIRIFETDLAIALANYDSALLDCIASSISAGVGSSSLSMGALILLAGSGIGGIGAAGIIFLSGITGISHGLIQGFPCSNIQLSIKELEVQRVINELHQCISSSSMQ